MRTVKKLIDDWKVAYGVEIEGKSGLYHRIEWKSERRVFKNLIQTILDEGYEKDIFFSKTSNMHNPSLLADVLYACYGEKEWSSRSKKDLAWSKKKTTANWDWAIDVVFAGPVSEHKSKPKETKKTKPTVVKSESEPVEEKPRATTGKAIKMDTSDIVKGDFNLDLLQELGLIDPIDEEKHE